MSDFFPQQAANSYDEKNKKLAAISDNLHFLIQLVLKDLPPRSRILCVGVGTGAEILSLSQAYPEWSFVGVDPSAPMLEVCRERLKAAGVMERCELIHGHVQDSPTGESFDAAISILVAHFVKREERLSFVQELMGATPESLASLPEKMREVLTILPPDETESLLRQSGIRMPIRFFQALMICGWYGKKE